MSTALLNRGKWGALETDSHQSPSYNCAGTLKTWQGPTYGCKDFHLCVFINYGWVIPFLWMSGRHILTVAHVGICDCVSVCVLFTSRWPVPYWRSAGHKLQFSCPFLHVTWSSACPCLLLQHWVWQNKIKIKFWQNPICCDYVVKSCSR